MAQIIKHRRGQLTGVKSLTARNAEFIIASGSISDLQGPFVFIGSPNSSDEGVAGAFKSVSKIYQGTTAPSITAGSYGSILDGTPFYASGNKSLYILNNDGAGGNTRIDLTGNLEGNTISGITINNITGSKATFSTFVSASALNVSGNTQMVGNSTVGGTLGVTGKTTAGSLEVLGNTTLDGTLTVTGAVYAKDTLMVDGATTLNSSADIIGSATVGGDMTITGNTGLGGTLDVDGVLTANDNLEVVGSTTLNDTLNVSGKTTLDSLEVLTTTNLDGALSVTGAVKFVNTQQYQPQNVSIISEYASQLLFVVSGSQNGSIYSSNPGELVVNANTVKINNLSATGSFSGSFVGDGLGLYNIPASGITGLELNQIGDGSATASISQTNGFRVNTNSEITGGLKVTGNISGSNMYLSGNALIDGNIVLGGNINIGNQTTDLITFGGEVSSSIVPEVNNAFDLGSSTKAWRDLYVSGTAYVGVLEAGTISLDGITVFDDLSVNGNTYLGNDSGDTVVISGSIYNDALTAGRVLIAGTDGEITDDADLTFDGATLQVGLGSVEIDSDGDIRTSGSLTVTSNTLLKGAADLNSTLQVSGTTTLKDTLSVSGATTVGGATTLNSSLQTKGNTTLEGTLTVSGSSTLKDNLSVSGTTTVAGATTLKDNLSVSGSTTVGGTTELKGAVGMNSSLEVTGSVVLDNTLQTKGNTTLEGLLTVSGSATLKTNLSVSGTTTVGGATLLKDNLSVSGITSIDGATSVNNTLTVSGATSLNNTLTVVGASELKGNVGINSNLDVTGSVQIDTDLNVTGDSNLNDTYVSNLTQGNVTLAGANGQLVDNADLSFNGSELSIGQGNATININGDIATVGTLAVAGLENTGDLSVGGVLTVSGNTELQGDLYVSGNLQVLGSQTTVTIQSTTVELDDNIIRLNAYSPFERYAGFEVIDSGSSNTSASLLWDSANDYWLFMSSSGQSSKLIGTTAGTYGSETSLTSGTFPIASAGNTIGDSLLTYSGTTLALNTNKFTVDSSSGDTLVSGNFTLSATGGADNNTKTSAIMFRNSDNVIGFVSTTETEDVLDGILGYKHSNGGLTFSTVIDGGTY